MMPLNRNLAAYRLHNQKLARPELRDPAEIVAWLGAVQSQDYSGAKWALGQRGTGLTDAAVEQAFNEGRILRTHVMRPTWHFVTPADIRWMLALTAPRVSATCASYYRKNGIDSGVLARSNAALTRALRGGNHLTRSELAAILQRAGIAATGTRLGLLMMRAELDQVICSGPRRGKQFTYALLDERTPKATMLNKEEALAELTRRYFRSHGPATVRDFVWWSGLTVLDAKAGLDMNRSSLVQETVRDRTYWFVPQTGSPPASAESVYLLPNYDEYLIAYKDRGRLTTPGAKETVRKPDVFAYHLIVDGDLAGSWKRTFKVNTVIIDVAPYASLTRANARGLADAAERQGKFLGMDVKLSLH